MSEAGSPVRALGGNRLTLGLFAPNCSGGLAITRVPERWDASWESNRRLALMADEAGLDFLLPIARWTGYGGSSGFHFDTLETITWATGLLALTRRIHVFATAHLAFMHPIVAAKQAVTIDHISDGRFGLNLVCGWNQPEYEMFGLDLPPEHKARYAYGQEWLVVVERLWSADEPFDWNGTYFHLKHAFASPKPLGRTRPLLFNAGFSPEGRGFAARNADFLLTTLTDPETDRTMVSAIREDARRLQGRDIGVVGTAYVVCRPSTKEAHDYHRHYAELNADDEAVDRLMQLQGLHAKSFPPETLRLHRSRFAGGHGGYPIIGSPDEVADELERVAAAGFAGVALGLVNFLDELPYFRDEVLPRLEAKGLRVPIA